MIKPVEGSTPAPSRFEKSGLQFSKFQWLRPNDRDSCIVFIAKALLYSILILPIFYSLAILQRIRNAFSTKNPLKEKSIVIEEPIKISPSIKKTKDKTAGFSKYTAIATVVALTVGIYYLIYFSRKTPVPVLIHDNHIEPRLFCSQRPFMEQYPLKPDPTISSCHLPSFMQRYPLRSDPIVLSPSFPKKQAPLKCECPRQSFMQRYPLNPRPSFPNTNLLPFLTRKVLSPFSVPLLFLAIYNLWLQAYKLTHPKLCALKTEGSFSQKAEFLKAEFFVPSYKSICAPLMLLTFIVAPIFAVYSIVWQNHDLRLFS